VAAAAAQQSQAQAPDNSQLLALLQEWQTQQQQNKALAAAQAATLATPLEGAKFIGAFQAGGVAQKSGFALVGERGPELMPLSAGQRIYSNHDSQSMMQPVVIVQVLDGAVDSSKIRTIAGDEARRLSTTATRNAARMMPGRGGGIYG